MEYVYTVHTLSGKFLDIVCKTRESAQEECDKLFEKNPSKSYTYYQIELKGKNMTKIKHKVKVTTFKESGKYYDEFTIEVEAPNKWFYVMEAVKAYKPTHQVQTDMDWLIGMDEEGSTPEVANSIYPTIIKG